MNAKSKRTKRESPGWTHKSIRNELERSITLMVLSSPSLEHAIISNYLARKGYTVQEEDVADAYLHVVYNLPLPDKKRLAWRAKRKAEAEKLYQLAEEMRAENKAHTAEVIAKEKAPKPGKLAKKGSESREQNVDRLLKQVLYKKKENDEQNKNDDPS